MELWAQYGLAGLVAGATLALVWKVVDRAWAALESRGQAEVASSSGPSGLNALQCRVDPLHFQNIKEVHAMVSDWNDRIHRGEFTCVWRDRDEIRDLLETLRDSHQLHEASLVATRELTAEVRALALELRTTRNGGTRP